jgi:hypothetical protein
MEHRFRGERRLRLPKTMKVVKVLMKADKNREETQNHAGDAEKNHR